MEKDEVGKLTELTKQAIEELLEAASLKPGNIILIGCSTSEVQGKRIGKASSMEIGGAILDAVLPIIKEKGLYLAVQACEHLNRALLVEEECMNKYGWEEVAVVPYLKAGGGFATIAYQRFDKAVMVESIEAHAGMDIGDTFIGMHLKKVLVPVRSEIKKLGEAHLSMARTRPKLIGGERARYQKK